MDQLSRTHAQGSFGQGRSLRLLDVLVHQLPAHISLPAFVVQPLPRRRARDRRRPLAGVRLRKGAQERGGRGQASRRHMADHALDDNMTIWDKFENQASPADYFADRRGRIRYSHIGEGEYTEAENVIRQLLGVAATSTAAAEGRRRRGRLRDRDQSRDLSRNPAESPARLDLDSHGYPHLPAIERGIVSGAAGRAPRTVDRHGRIHQIRSCRGVDPARCAHAVGESRPPPPRPASPSTC